MLTARYAASFTKDYKRLQKRGYDMEKLRRVMKCLLLRTGTHTDLFK